jgi:hypothetical protein
VPACLDTLLIGLYCLADDLLEPRTGAGRRPRLTDAELVCLAVAQVLLDVPGDRRSSRSPGGGWGTCFRICPNSPATTNASGRSRRRSCGC